jgi:predicted RNA-binding protein with PUA-like domain
MHPSQKGNYRSWENKRIEGIKQIEKYKKLNDIKELNNLHSYLIISDGEKLEIIEVE